MLQGSVVESPPSKCGDVGSTVVGTWKAAGASATAEMVDRCATFVAPSTGSSGWTTSPALTTCAP
jgi:hypothetical protein